MSRQTETVERVFELFNRLPLDAGARRSSPVTAELLELFTDDIEFTQPAIQPEGAQVFTGREQLRDSWDQWFEVWEHHRSHPEELVEHGDFVLALSSNHFRGRDGVELEHPGGSIFIFEGVKIAQLEAFFDQETARRRFDELRHV